MTPRNLHNEASILLALALASCASAARFHTDPEGALLYVNGQRIGTTPVAYANDPGLAQRYHVQIVKPGYEPLDFYLDNSLSWIWGYCGLMGLVPYLWGWSLSGDHVFHLIPLHDERAPPSFDEEEPPLAPTEERL